MSANVRAVEDERALVLGVRDVECLELPLDLGVLLVFGAAEVFERGPVSVCGWVVELRVHFPALALEGERQCWAGSQLPDRVK